MTKKWTYIPCSFISMDKCMHKWDDSCIISMWFCHICVIHCLCIIHFYFILLQSNTKECIFFYYPWWTPTYYKSIKKSNIYVMWEGWLHEYEPLTSCCTMSHLVCDIVCMSMSACQQFDHNPHLTDHKIALVQEQYKQARWN